MAQLKQLSAGSSQIIMMMFRDKNNAPIKALFYANRQEVQKGVNLNTDPYNKSTTLLLVYQMSNNQTIQQTLPPVSDNRIIILELIQEPGAANYKAIISPAGDASYRYTYNKTAGNIPLGIKKGLALVSNNNAWADPGASDPNKVQGDLLAEADGIITIQYSGQAYNETSTMNEANFWAVKVAPDGSLTEVPNSRYSTTIEANRKIAKNIQSKSISFPIQQGESVRFLANSNIDGGFYLQSGTDGKPLFEVIVNFKEMVGMPFIPDELEKGATEFYE